MVTIQYRRLGLPISFRHENSPKQHKLIYHASSQSTHPPFSFLVFLSFLLSSVPATQTQTQTLASRLLAPFSIIFAFVGPGPYYSDPGCSSISSFFFHFCFRRSLLLRLRPWLLVYFLLFRSFLLSSVPTTQTRTQTLASRLFYDIDSKGKQCKPVCPFCTFLNPISSTDLYIFLLH